MFYHSRRCQLSLTIAAVWRVSKGRGRSGCDDRGPFISLAPTPFQFNIVRRCSKSSFFFPRASGARPRCVYLFDGGVITVIIALIARIERLARSELWSLRNNIVRLEITIPTVVSTGKSGELMAMQPPFLPIRLANFRSYLKG